MKVDNTKNSKKINLNKCISFASHKSCNHLEIQRVKRYLNFLIISSAFCVKSGNYAEMSETYCSKKTTNWLENYRPVELCGFMLVRFKAFLAKRTGNNRRFFVGLGATMIDKVDMERLFT